MLRNFSKLSLSMLISVRHSVKSVHIRSYSGPYFPAFGLNTEKYSVSLRIQSECGKIRTRKSSVSGHFSRCGFIQKWINLTNQQFEAENSFLYQSHLSSQLNDLSDQTEIIRNLLEIICCNYPCFTKLRNIPY